MLYITTIPNGILTMREITGYKISKSGKKLICITGNKYEPKTFNIGISKNKYIDPLDKIITLIMKNENNMLRNILSTNNQTITDFIHNIEGLEPTDIEYLTLKLI